MYQIMISPHGRGSVCRTEQGVPDRGTAAAGGVPLVAGELAGLRPQRHQGRTPDTTVRRRQR
ncbi:MAG TPA: hypothetical protein VN748_19320 [Pseudonocardiaceae bacterium]|nr:hypothetical protein [Pseudonocardiaceae bacterium]